MVVAVMEVASGGTGLEGGGGRLWQPVNARLD